MAKVWSKRFDNTINPFIEKFNASISFDKTLIFEDIDCSIAHAKMLGKTKVLSSSESLKIIEALKFIKQDFIDRCGDVINLHNSPLPKYRGVRPINWALKNNEETHGVTVHRVTKGIDDGPILGQVVYPIYPEIEEVEDVYNKALDYGWLLFKDVMTKYDYARKHAKPQKGSHPYYSMKIVGYLGEREGFERPWE